MSLCLRWRNKIYLFIYLELTCTFCGSRFSTRRPLAIEDFTFILLRNFAAMRRNEMPIYKQPKHHVEHETVHTAMAMARLFNVFDHF